MSEAGPGEVGDGFDREDLVVAGVEGELPGGLRPGFHGVGAQGDAAHPGALQAEGCVRLIRGARQDHGVLGGLGQGPGSARGGLVGVADGAGQCLGDLVAGTEAGAEGVGQGEQGAPVLSGVKFVAVEAVFGTEADRRGGGRRSSCRGRGRVRGGCGRRGRREGAAG